MSTLNFENVTRRLDLNPASVDTTYDKTRSRGRIIEKIPYTFVIPEFSTTVASETGARVGCLMSQVNYTFPAAFRIIKTNFYYIDFSTLIPFVAIKYRVNGVVTRYYLPFTNDTAVDNYSANARGCQCPRYNGEVIQPNFTIEFWRIHSSGFGHNYFLPASRVVSNLLINPPSASDTYNDVAASEALTRANLGGVMPETLPKTYVSGSSWLTN